MADAYPSERHAGKRDRERGGSRATGGPRWFRTAGRIPYLRGADPPIQCAERR